MLGDFDIPREGSLILPRKAGETGGVQWVSPPAQPNRCDANETRAHLLQARDSCLLAAIYPGRRDCPDPGGPESWRPAIIIEIRQEATRAYNGVPTYLKQLHLLMLGQQQFARICPVGRMLPPMLAQATWMTVHLGTTFTAEQPSPFSSP
jgi:hypothetical protein